LSIDISLFLEQLSQARGSETYFKSAREVRRLAASHTDLEVRGKLELLNIFLLHAARLLESDPDPELSDQWNNRLQLVIHELFSEDRFRFSNLANILSS
jgi:hypothetical protein